MSVGVLVSQHQEKIDRESARVLIPRSSKNDKVSHMKKLVGVLKSPKVKAVKMSKSKHENLVNFGVGRLGESGPVATKKLMLGFSTIVSDGGSMVELRGEENVKENISKQGSVQQRITAFTTAFTKPNN